MLSCDYVETFSVDFDESAVDATQEDGAIDTDFCFQMIHDITLMKLNCFCRRSI